jgi:hypothetical protein
MHQDFAVLFFLHKKQHFESKPPNFFSVKMFKLWS